MYVYIIYTVITKSFPYNWEKVVRMIGKSIEDNFTVNFVDDAFCVMFTSDCGCPINPAASG